MNVRNVYLSESQGVYIIIPAKPIQALASKTGEGMHELTIEAASHMRQYLKATSKNPLDLNRCCKITRYLIARV